MSKNLEIKESLLEGAATSQRLNGILPTVKENEDLFVGVLEKIDQQPKQKKTAEKKETPGDYRIGDWDRTTTAIKEKPVPKKRALTMLEKKILIERKLLDHRVKLLRSKPAWKKKVETIVGMMLASLTPEQHQYSLNKLVELFEESNKTFGDWRKLPPQTLFFTGGS